ncbi:methyltransferase type 11 [Coprinopsis sp. MPI-PUGE-AT-0042]|nr:methyltransferase type 11 [Coprinopsis sp. MPI-PUGE-AT-0042]
MGNSPSTILSEPPTLHEHRVARRVLSRISLRCTSPPPSTHTNERWLGIRQSADIDAKERQSLQQQQPEPKASPGPISILAYASISSPGKGDQDDEMYGEFIRVYPEYRLTWILDTLRRTDYTRLERTGETYVDYMGASLYPESLIQVHADFLHNSVLGNTHSASNASQLSLDCASEARAAVLAFFKAPPDYTVIFTANATAALKLVGESFPFVGGSSYVLGMDSHNSVNGIREYANHRGARSVYMQALPSGGLDPGLAKNTLLRHRPRNKELTPSLFAITAQSNVTNSKAPLSSLASYASSLGYRVLVDAAALVPTSPFSLTEVQGIDAMAVSFYKMFGFPTGVGALIVKRSFLAELKRPWFSGGTVDIVQVPGHIVTMSKEPHEQFEDGTINFLSLRAVVDGLRFLTAYMPFLPLRLSCLLNYLVTSLLAIKHDTNGAPLIHILSKMPTSRVPSIGEGAETGFTVSFLVLDPWAGIIPISFIEHAASKQKISLRTGCVCNPGGTAALLGLSEDMAHLNEGITLQGLEQRLGRELGVVRVSLGLASNFHDVQRVIRFATSLGNTQIRQSLMDAWQREKQIPGPILE